VHRVFRHFLVVEDDPDDVFLIQKYLQDACGDYSIEAVTTAADAEIHLNRAKVDLVLLDLSLPDATALEALQRLRRTNSSVPIVVLSGLPETFLALEAVRTGAQDYLSKTELNSQTLSKSVSYALERQSLEQQLQQAQKMESVGRLAGGIAHDFNNLLTVIRASTDLLKYGGCLVSDGPQWVEQIEQTTERAASLIKRLLLFSRNDPPHFELLNPNEVVSGLAKLLSRTLSETVDFQVDLDPSAPWIKGDRHRLEQVILNLTVNAGDAMPNGGKLIISTRTVAFEANAPRSQPEAKPGDYLHLQVKDSGQGIAPELLHKIFEPFFTTKEPGKGTGLGLSIVYSIVKEHQGWIDLRSEVGVGTTVDVYFPKSDKVELQDVLSGWSRTRSHVRQAATILYVEDDATLRMLYQQLLGQEGYRVHVAASGPQALKLFENPAFQVDLLVSDIVMPGGMSGVQLAAEIETKMPGIKVLLVTGYSPEKLPEIDERFHLLLKPFSKDELVDKIETLLQLAPASAEARNPRDACTT
jgi:two-component system, cell cycle sensor histidine kinase and response regulator CckA